MTIETLFWCLLWVVSGLVAVAIMLYTLILESRQTLQPIEVDRGDLYFGLPVLAMGGWLSLIVCAIGLVGYMIYIHFANREETYKQPSWVFRFNKWMNKQAKKGQ